MASSPHASQGRTHLTLGRVEGQDPGALLDKPGYQDLAQCRVPSQHQPDDQFGQWKCSFGLCQDLVLSLMQERLGNVRQEIQVRYGKVTRKRHRLRRRDLTREDRT